ncbi:4-amino-4-deoxy-L-arabinose transferase-like glycosyltransferase [Actinomycetospora succinea]|uniref:4-amino-4-deoxy-L-arabinose transferase-like glycosyltransferase n=1 Tax=Actinomycetospora succinea TaxID=663603 RepID=A0A4R6VJU2_9PSEU|nr:glycosyltransferase family 39 protein [Actinomycetospora succinea]TDQ63116.1 4-amino-4-deoxy-L-arabinose transferase-like glycosyltransferase [Actinomycetospora succinea]
MTVHDGLTTELRVPRRAPAPPAHRAPARRSPALLVGRPDDPRWVRPSLIVLLVGTAVLYLENLGASGFANTYYAAAVQAGTQSWKAWLFGSMDSSNFITVDKPPASLWVMGLSGRLFGFSSWSMLAPQALMGVAAVGLLYLAVRRWSGPGAGLLAGAALALTPVAVLMFRFNNPDALLVLCLVAAAYEVVRAVDAAATRAGTWWTVAAGALIGFGFLTKMMQAFLVLPAFAAVLLLASAAPLRRRLVQLGAGALALVVSVGWYVLLVDLWPTDARPYIGGSTDNTLLDLVLGYNGLGRLLGGEGNGGAGGGGGGGTGFGGSTGITRMFNEAFGGQISWLLPAALVALVAGLWLTRRAPRTDRTRAALVLWGGWLLVTGLVFSFMSGTIHAYYAVALAPGLVGTLVVGGREVWRRRGHLAADLTLGLTVTLTAGWSVVLLRRTPEFLPWLRWVVAIAGIVAAVGLVVPRSAWRRLGGRVLPVVLLGALLAGAGGATAYAVQTAATAHQGSIVSAGPSTGSEMGGGPGGGQGGGQGGPPGGGQRPAGQAPPDGGQRGGGGGQSGGPGEASTSAELTALLTSAGTRWSAATVSAQGASGLELSSGTAVMAIGGFTGSDAAPSLAQFQAYVAAGDIGWFVASGGQGDGPGGGEDSVGTQISNWVAAHYTATTVGGTTVYDLTQPAS